MEESMAGLFQVLWGQPDRTFAKAATLNGTDDKPLIIPIEGESRQTENICTRPSAVDWDGDGDLDLLVGNFSGTFYLFTGESGGRFLPEPQPVLADGEPLRIAGVHSDPFVVDWDGDGDLDVLSGSSNGGVQWAENTGSAGQAPTLKPFRSLIKPEPRVEHDQPLRDADLTGPTRATRVWVDDVNSDGKLDILVGDSVSLISPADGVSAEDFKVKYADWKNALDQAFSDLNSTTTTEDGEADKDDEAKDEPAASERISKLYEERSEFMNEESTGFVWLYLRK
jgi:hypothetical protein